jgi:D-amino-acid dehydrogenase
MRIVIIGAGVLGASAAYHLAKAGAEVTAIDANLDGRATAAGAGIICPWVSDVDDPAFQRLYTAGGEYYPDLIAALGQGGESETGYRQTGAMLVSGDAAELDWFEIMARRRAGAAAGMVSRMSAKQARARFPPLRPDLGGVFIAGGSRVDGRGLTAALLRVAGSRGATIRQGHAAAVVAAGRVIAVEVGGQRIPAERVIVTAGAWSDQVLREVGLGVTVEPQRGQIMHLQLNGAQTEDWPVILPPGSHYIVPFDGGRVVAGATRESGTGFDYRVTAGGQAEVLAAALSVAPGLAAATVLETRVGFRPTGAQVRPSLGWVRGIDGLAVGTGLGAAGLTIGPIAGRLLADLVTGQAGLMDLRPFDPMRRIGSGAERPGSLR